jgi:hypothetical protein
MKTEPDTKPTPALVVLVEFEGTYLWKVQECPHCGGKHTHGGGSVEYGRPREFLGHRATHCGGDGYQLIELQSDV